MELPTQPRVGLSAPKARRLDRGPTEAPSASYEADGFIRPLEMDKTKGLEREEREWTPALPVRGQRDGMMALIATEKSRAAGLP